MVHEHEHVSYHDPAPISIRFCLRLHWHQHAWAMHHRWAMLAAAGILFEDLLGHLGAGGPAAKTPWFDAGKFEYFAPASTLTIVEFILFAWVETRRYQDMVKPGRCAHAYDNRAALWH